MTTARNPKPTEPTLGDLLKFNDGVRLSAYQSADGRWLYTASLDARSGDVRASASAFTVEEAIATLIRRQALRPAPAAVSSHPTCSICRSRHGSEIQHACE